MFSQEKYLKALNYAAKVHGEQKTPKGLPYITHLTSVAMEMMHACEQGDVKLEDADFVIQVALLHDVLEDTDATISELIEEFGDEIASGVEALTKDPTIESKKQQMAENINRLLTQSYAVQCVKLADRITNLQKPPQSWDNEKIYNYFQESKFILSCLKNANPFLSKRLEDKINIYRTYIK
ncbi:metal dependent phosphohydrolase [Arcobacter nitrofigilis DSM 7299]|uniref:Metal dependent phosphohydrolase n=1 Tax=Arcobacter nitrofigilis (strain ATCC 33309 / DSM 7299 / CCUG 15893 / LMG 7604 / NCTC 12251 / CI) TaxID=572480 RepID=D5V0J7_ARCNC|nr:HD domain-containing protein [Arcobacter nitrofigilis]ADG93809.1 metal dependent phosphohydrolase [Arcobacter nitrofigilis DSM 7299]